MKKVSNGDDNIVVIHKDEIPSFIPKGKPKLIILGTMCAINARTINGIKPKEDFFYYNNNRNHFWKVLQYLFEPKAEPIKMTIKEKKAFLNKHSIAIQNLVYEAKVPNKYIHDPSDTVLFEAFKKNNVKFKSLSKRDRSYFEKIPLFFTCRYKKGIKNLLEGFLRQNDLDLSLVDQTWYWPTPTRCNPYDRSQIWKKEMDDFLKIDFPSR